MKQPLHTRPGRPAPLREEWLHYIWQRQLFRSGRKLRTENGLPIRVVHPGHYNRDAGPDFHHALLQIDGLLWAGHVELHLTEQDWFRHGHQHDPAYGNVVLHVVLHRDRGRATADKAEGHPPFLLCLENVAKMPEARALAPSGKGLMKLPAPACSPAMRNYPANKWQDLLLIRAEERQQHKAERVRQLLLANGRDWHETAWQLLAEGLGMQKNREPMLELAKRLTFARLRKMSNQPQVLLAAALGTAGLLHKWPGDAVVAQKNYNIAKAFLDLPEPMDPVHWLYGKIMPASQPHRRIMQWVALGVADPALPVMGTRTTTTAELHDWLALAHRLVPAADPIGKDLQEHLLINELLPLRRVYLEETKRAVTTAAELALLPKENNAITRLFAAEGVKARNALEAQGIIQLYKKHCLEGRCATCTAGHLLLDHSQPRLDLLQEPLAEY